MGQKRIAIIGTVGIPACYGGFETLAENLVAFEKGNYQTTVYCSGKTYPKEVRKEEYKGAKLVYLPLKANGIQSILYDTLSILHSLFYSDVLLVLGVAGAWIFPFVRWFTNKKIIVSIDGIEWKLDKWNRLAKSYLWWAEKIAVRYSHVDISDNESIQDYTAMRYGTLSNIIEYGADHVLRVSPTRKDLKQYPFMAKSYAFNVSRIVPENNIHVILEAFANLSEYNLVMVGNWNNSAYGIDLKERFSSYRNIHLLDPIYSQQQLDLLRSNCILYLHGHSAGGTNPSLVEAMYLGLPILAYDVSYNRTTTDNKAIYFKNGGDIEKIVREKKLADFRQVGELMLQIAKRRYTWSVVSSKYSFLIQKALKLKSKKAIRPLVASIDKSRLRQINLNHLESQQLFYQK